MTVPGGPRTPPTPAATAALAEQAGATAAILVEGWSDQAALHAVARRRGCDLQREGVLVLPLGGATNIRPFADALGPGGLGLRLAGLCDAAELPYFRRRLDAARIFVCDTDLEDELIRALGTAAVEQVIEAERELASFRNFQTQPAQRGRALHAQLHRFIGTRAGRKIRYGALLVDALAPQAVPAVLDRVLEHA